jgi:hypothetical protein
MTLHEVWFGKKNSLLHIKVFLCDSFMHVPNENRNNMEKKEFKCIFIGYKEGMKGYTLWHPASRKAMYNQYLVFNEVGRKSELEVVQIENDPEKVRFELSNEEDD